MNYVRLVCWNKDLALEHASALQKAGLDVDASPFDPAGMITRLRENPPAAMLIDLDRLPSHGRSVALMVRASKSMRHIPIVFAGGVEEKVARVRTEVADAIFTDWAKAAQAVKKAIKNPPVAFVQPPPIMQQYAGSRLVKKLDLKPGTKAALIGAEAGFIDLLGDLPEGVELEPRITRNTKLVLWFVRASHEIAAAFELACSRMPEGCSIWIVYPKKAGRFRVDFNQNDIRLTGLQAGVVDYKICAVDADWSGMKFARRRTSVR